MDIEGRIIFDLGFTSGTSKAGNPWKKREMVLETTGTYPRKVKFHIFGDRADTIRLEVGKDYILSFDLESREFNGKWYTDVSVYRASDIVPNSVDNTFNANRQPGGTPAGNISAEPKNDFMADTTTFIQEDSFISGGPEEDLPF